MEASKRVLIADDRPHSRRALRALLATHPAIEVIGEAGDGREALRLVEAFQPDAVVMDAKMPAMDGMRATRTIKERWPTIRIIVLTMYGAWREEALGSGADAFLVKGCPAGKLLETILACEQCEP